MTEQERRDKFNEELQAICQKYACMQVVNFEQCMRRLPDGSLMAGDRHFIHVELMPMDSPPVQVETKT